jgi:PBP1b-binding outer membrane lipoprotein LpoB
MKRLVISAAIIGSAFIFTSCATDNAGQASSTNTPQTSPYAAPPNAAIFDDTGFNYWPLTLTYPQGPGNDTAD